MDHPGGPQRLEAGGHLGADLNRGADVQLPLALELFVERLTFDEPLRHIRQAFRLAGVDDGHHVWVLDHLGDSGFAIEAAPEGLVACVVLLDKLQRHRGPVGCGRSVDLAHPALAEQPVDGIVAEVGSNPRVVVAHRSLVFVDGAFAAWDTFKVSRHPPPPSRIRRQPLKYARKPMSGG